jgi:hypothetical protein
MTKQHTDVASVPGYIVAYGHQQAPVYAANATLAKIEGIALFNVSKNQHYLVSAVLVQEAKKEDIQFMEYVEHYYGGY